MKFEFYKKVKVIRCPGCGFQWVPRVAHPVKCPRCQFFFVKRINRQVKGTRQVKGRRGAKGTIRKAA